MIAKTLITAAALASFAAATPASAESYAFRYQSYELATKGGRSALMTRLENYIDRLCDANGSRSIFAQRASAECRGEVMDKIMAKIDNVEFAALGK